MNNGNIETILFTTVFVALIVGGFYFGFQRYERVECRKWQDYEREYRLFEPSETMYEQCDSYNINLK